MTSCNQTALEFSWSHRRRLNKFLVCSRFFLMGKWREKTRWWKWSQMENGVLKGSGRGMTTSCPFPKTRIPSLYCAHNHRSQHSLMIVRDSYRMNTQWKALGFSLTLTLLSTRGGKSNPSGFQRSCVHAFHTVRINFATWQHSCLLSQTAIFEAEFLLASVKLVTAVNE